MDMRITPGTLSGKIKVPPSKSMAHRLTICAALAGGTSRISPIEPTKDMQATIAAAKSLGASVSGDGAIISVRGINEIPPRAEIDCGESGSTLRFFVPVAAALGVSASFRGHGRLPQRPMAELSGALAGHGVTVGKKSGEILSVSGKLEPGLFEIGGDVSSQYVTGLLLALPLLSADSEIALTSPLQSRGYVDMTVRALKEFGVTVKETANGWHVPGNQAYDPRNCMVEGDYSNAAFWLCSAVLDGEIEAFGLDLRSAQGDMRILELVKQFGADLSIKTSSVIVRKSNCKAISLDISQIPDLMPILAVTAAFANGTTEIYNAARLRLKESDRLATVAAGLKALGAGVIEYPEKLVIIGQERLRGGGAVDSAGDHRIAMSMSIAAAYCQKPSVILGADCVDKSYPGFYEDFAMLGGICHAV